MVRGLFLEEAQEHLKHITEAQTVLARVSEGTLSVGTEVVDVLFRHLHTLKGAAGSVGFGGIARAAHDLEELCAEMRTGQLAPTPGILERMDEGVASLRALLEGARATPARPRAGMEALAVPQAISGETSGSSDDAANDQRRSTDRRSTDRRGLAAGIVRVGAERLDALLQNVGDLIIVRTRFERRLKELDGVLRDLGTTRARLRALLDACRAGTASPSDPAGAGLLDQLSEFDIDLADAVSHLGRAGKSLAAESESLRRTTDDVDEHLRRARQVPLEFLFHRLASAMRELERTAGRRADLVFHGGDIEIDKGVIDQIADPLLHLLRNAMAHGIEPTAERVAHGKSPRGRIELKASSAGDLITLQFEDDGRGLNLEGIRMALVRNGRLGANEQATDQRLVGAIFEPGFSSRAVSDSLSGRGMGMTIVKKALIRLGGDVTVEFDRGTFTRFNLSIPLAASITQALLFKVGGQVYALPAASVIEALPLGPHDLLVKDGEVEGVAVRGTQGRVPILRLQALLGGEVSPDRRSAALHLHHGERNFIVTCDKVIGPRTIVMRPLGPLLATLPLFAGVTVSGAGKAQLVLDLAALAQAAHLPPRHSERVSRRGPPRVLVVDDSRLSRESIARILLSAGYQAVTAEDGWDAFELLSERRFDAVVTDLEMPRMDGFELTTRIRHDATLRGLPIVVVSSRTARTTQDRARQAGANAVIAKGPNRRLLLDALADLLAGPNADRRTGT